MDQMRRGNSLRHDGVGGVPSQPATKKKEKEGGAGIGVGLRRVAGKWAGDKPSSDQD